MSALDCLDATNCPSHWKAALSRLPLPVLRALWEAGVDNTRAGASILAAYSEDQSAVLQDLVDDAIERYPPGDQTPELRHSTQVDVTTLCELALRVRPPGEFHASANQRWMESAAPDRLKKKIWCGKKKSEGWKKNVELLEKKISGTGKKNLRCWKKNLRCGKKKCEVRQKQILVLKNI